MSIKLLFELKCLKPTPLRLLTTTCKVCTWPRVRPLTDPFPSPVGTGESGGNDAFLGLDYRHSDHYCVGVGRGVGCGLFVTHWAHIHGNYRDQYRYVFEVDSCHAFQINQKLNRTSQTKPFNHPSNQPISQRTPPLPLSSSSKTGGGGGGGGGEGGRRGVLK